MIDNAWYMSARVAPYRTDFQKSLNTDWLTVAGRSFCTVRGLQKIQDFVCSCPKLIHAPRRFQTVQAIGGTRPIKVSDGQLGRVHVSFDFGMRSWSATIQALSVDRQAADSLGILAVFCLVFIQ